MPEVADRDRSATPRGFVQDLLHAARIHLDMEIAFVGELVGGRRLFRAVDSDVEPCPVVVGDSDPLEDTYCQRIIDGRLPELMRDAASVPEAAALPATTELPVGAHMGVPIRRRDGRVVGTFCCFSSQPDPTLHDRDLDTLRLLAELLANELERDPLLLERQQSTAEEIRRVVRGNAMRIVFQPIVDLEASRVAGYEALARFDLEPYRPPDAWFAQAAAVGMGTQLERRAVSLAVQHLDELRGAYLAVNLSGPVAGTPDLGDALEGADLPRLVVEITEEARVEDSGALRRNLAPLRESGLRVSIDDAGKGYSGLERVLELAPDMIKIDREITSGVDADPARQAMAAALVQFGRATGATIVAEGIEREAELVTLRSLGVAYGQGFLLGRPGPELRPPQTATSST